MSHESLKTVDDREGGGSARNIFLLMLEVISNKIILKELFGNFRRGTPAKREWERKVEKKRRETKLLNNVFLCRIFGRRRGMPPESGTRKEEEIQKTFASAHLIFGEKVERNDIISNYVGPNFFRGVVFENLIRIRLAINQYPHPRRRKCSCALYWPTICENLFVRMSYFKPLRLTLWSLSLTDDFRELHYALK